MVLGQTEGTLVALHEASFIVWFGAAAVHVPALAAGAVTAGVLLAVVANRLQDRVSAQAGLDSD